MNIITQGKK